MAVRRLTVSDGPVRFGEADLTTCDREPIHIPGSIQPHGVLLVVDREQRIVEQVAGESPQLLGLEPQRVLGQSVAALFEEDVEEFVRLQLVAQPDFVAPIVRLGVRTRLGPTALDLTLHATAGTAILELEPATRTTTSAGDPIAQLKTLVAAIQRTITLDECCAAAALAMRAATGFDRAMVYRFLRDGSGVVVAEVARADLESFLGLHYPASDIPKQARELYRRNWLRSIPTSTTLRRLFSRSSIRAPGQPDRHESLRVCAASRRSTSSTCVTWACVLHSPLRLSVRTSCGGCSCCTIIRRGMCRRTCGWPARPSRRSSRCTWSQAYRPRRQYCGARTRAILEKLVEPLTAGSDIGRVLACDDLLRYVGASGAVVYFDGRLHRVGSTPPADGHSGDRGMAQPRQQAAVGNRAPLRAIRACEPVRRNRERLARGGPVARATRLRAVVPAGDRPHGALGGGSRRSRPRWTVTACG